MENQRHIVLPVVLKGNNYILWSRTTRTVLRSRGLWEHIDGSQEKPYTAGVTDVGDVAEAAEAAEGDEGDVESPIKTHATKDSKWNQEDQLVLAVLQSSLEQSILAAYSYVESAKELWDTLMSVYGNTSSLSRIFEVKKALNELRQDEKPYKDIFGEFRGLWAELEMLRPPTTDAKEMIERREQDQVFGLLLTLNGSFKEMIHHVLRYEKLPTLNEVCMTIQKEEGSRGLFHGTSETAHVSIRPSSFQPRTSVFQPRRNSFQLAEKRTSVCDHCKFKGHTKEQCWILHPHLRPSWHTGQVSRGNALVASTGNEEVVRRSDLDALIKSITKLTESGKGFLASKPHKAIIIDSGASHHMISDEQLLSNVESHSGKVTIANGQDIAISGIGDLEIFKKKSKALYLPEFTSNLLSIHKATKDLDCLAVFSPNDVRFQDIKSGSIIGEGCEKDGLYLLGSMQLAAHNPSAFNSGHAYSFWHARLGHPHPQAFHLIFPGLDRVHQDCEACILGKHCRTVFPDSSTVFDECFDLIHSDVWTAPCNSRDQYKYFVTFIDAKSKYTWVTLMPSKNYVLEAFAKFHSYVSTQFGAKIKILRSDNGGEYISNQFKILLGKHGIVHQTSCAYTPQQNGVSERKNRHLMEVARTMMFDRGVPKHYWGDAVMTACYLINRLPTKHLQGLSPYEVLNHTKPSIDHLRVFGCTCYVFIPEAQRNKLEPKSMKCIFIGYSSGQKGYKCYDPSTRRVHISREVKFDEGRGFFGGKNWESVKDITSQHDRAATLQGILDGLNTSSRSLPTPSAVEKTVETKKASGHNEAETSASKSGQDGSDLAGLGELNAADLGGSNTTDHERSDSTGPNTTDTADLENEIVEDSEEGESEEEPAPPLRRSERVRHGPENWKNTRVYYNTHAVAHPIQGCCSIAHLPSKYQSFLSKVDQTKVPTSYEEACLSEAWVRAMLDEIASMKKNDTWEMVDLPIKKKVVGCRWVYTVKYKSSGEIERYKARLVAKGFTQRYGEDYKETFAPVAKLHSIRALLSVATNLSWDLWQMDVKNAFLQGNLEEEVYMATPKGFCDKFNGTKVCKLKKAIYGLKQSPRAWYQRLSNCLIDADFQRSEADHTLFTTQGEEGMVVVLIYVDDIIITGDNVDGVKETKKLLKTSFDIKDLGELKYFLGIELCKVDQGMFLSQRRYALDLLTETGKLGSKPCRTPIEESYKDEPEGEPEADAKQYQRMVGKLIYLTITRPDICFAVNRASQHMKAPTRHHWRMVERILRYIKATPGKGIWMGRNSNTEIVGYCDADWAGDRIDRKSTTGYCTFIGGNLVTWKSKKQKVISRSSAEAEYRAMANITGELVWLKSLLKDLGVKSSEPIVLHCDNQAAIHIASNSVFHERTKHIEVDCHYIREKVQAGIIIPSYVKSSDNVADIFTKATTSKICDELHLKIGLLDLHQPILRGSVERKLITDPTNKGSTDPTNKGSIDPMNEECAGPQNGTIESS